MAPTPCAKSNQAGLLTPSSKTHMKTPQSKHRLNFSNSTKPSPNPNSAALHQPADHPVEVIGRIRDYPDRKDKPISVLQVNSDAHSVRLRTEIGYRDFTLDGISLSEDEDLDGFYKNFVQSRINGVKLGDKCTIMMYGPTGSGKSHTMFGCAKQQGIVYKSLRDILGNGEDEQKVGVGTFVQVSVLEIYNEEIYDLLSTNTSNASGFSIGWSRPNASKVKLEVMGKKAKNATFISGTEAGKISKEIQKVEKRRIVKSTFCNERSSRSHCMIILDVPTVGGRLMLVDMAGSENIEQAGQIGLEAKMQTGKINQGNIALKRVVESIANGDSHVPFRDSKLTMLLQDSFEDDKSKILMILCASPDPKEMHKTISTLEYGAKAKCIVRGPHTPIKDKGAEDSASDVILGSRIAAMDQFIYKLQVENKIREKEKIEAHKQLMKKEEEIAALRAKLEEAEEKKALAGTSEEEINIKVNERTNMLRSELEKKIEECQKMADQVVEMERRKMEEKISQQQEELEMLRRRLEEIESELTRSRCIKDNENGNRNVSSSMEGSSFAKRLMGIYADEDPGMEKSMDLDKSLDMDMGKRDHKTNKSSIQAILGYPFMDNLKNEEYDDVFVPNSTSKAFLSTVFEEDEEEEDRDKAVDDEVQKEVIEEKTVYSVKSPNNDFNFDIDSLTPSLDAECGQDTTSSRHLRIQNIFTLCGNYRELSQHTATPLTTESPAVDKPENKQMAQVVCDSNSKENCSPLRSSNDKSELVEVVVKWEAASIENGGKVITTLRLVKDATLADLRKLIEIYLAADNQAFTFLALGGDPTGTPVAKEEEAWVLASKLPTCSNNGQKRSQHLACLRSAKKVDLNHIPFSSLENKLPFSSLENKIPLTLLENKSAERPSFLIV
ncbi:kinesin-like protein KIN-10A [Cynara cardunculus var. scolymus]|uniref:Kinesin-like protein KIN-10A n=1 Tax=Cynara cardunculus var. scolymus TaxID=59895 RepID=A0A103XI34_CYNCS|nr:kinesin-like protein KIN-10A [Cynara cardunculus var. scolymus]KVH91028.1 Kinesin, motor domain-containing protein [Cynara cardunculus var. scolymus]